MIQSRTDVNERDITHPLGADSILQIPEKFSLSPKKMQMLTNLNGLEKLTETSDSQNEAKIESPTSYFRSKESLKKEVEEEGHVCPVS